jgi:hypothetical protein
VEDGAVRLTELDPQFIQYEKRDDGTVFFKHVDTLNEAQGIKFLCPKCFVDKGGSVGTHGVICWSRSKGVPEEARPNPGRWKMDGTGYGDLTLNADPPGTARSVQLLGGCKWHGHVTNGDAI